MRVESMKKWESTGLERFGERERNGVINATFEFEKTGRTPV